MSQGMIMLVLSGKNMAIASAWPCRPRSELCAFVESKRHLTKGLFISENERRMKKTRSFNLPLFWTNNKCMCSPAHGMACVSSFFKSVNISHWISFQSGTNGGSDCSCHDSLSEFDSAPVEISPISSLLGKWDFVIRQGTWKAASFNCLPPLKASLFSLASYTQPFSPFTLHEILNNPQWFCGSQSASFTTLLFLGRQFLSKILQTQKYIPNSAK